MSFDLTPGEDLRQILDAAETMLGAHYPVTRLGEGRADDLAPLEDFGAFALAVAEDDGGAGFTLVEEAQLHVALGRHLVTPRALATAVARRLDAGATVCAGVAEGEGWLALDPGGAEAILVRDGGGLVLAALGDTTPVEALGQAMPMARVAPGADNRRADAATEAVARLLTSAQLLGVATGACDLAVEYARTREQFGRPIGSFQAIKHQAADMAIGIEQVSALVDMAAIALRDGHEDAGFQLSALARLAPRVALANARTGIQIHGGIGFSAEADAHLYLKQAHVLRQFLGADDIMSHSAPLTPY
jgi:alkylation response protein AidB-like acyl-CoA dehydrogenase